MLKKHLLIPLSIPALLWGLYLGLQAVGVIPDAAAANPNKGSQQTEPELVKPKSIAEEYIKSWAARDFKRMWNTCSKEPYCISQKMLELSMTTFPIYIQNEIVLSISFDGNTKDRIIATYRVEGPSLGCILVIARSAEPEFYKYYLERVERSTIWNGTLTMKKKGTEWKVADDNNPLIGTMSMVYSMQLNSMLLGKKLNPEIVFASIATGEAMRMKMETKEFRDKYYPDMVSCHNQLSKQ